MIKSPISTIGDRISAMRIEKRLSQAELGRQAGVTRSAIAQLESGLSKSPSAENVLRIADALGVDARYLTFGADGPPPAPEQLLADMLTLIPAEQRQEAMDFTLYKIEKSEAFIASEKLPVYLTMMEKMKQDLAAKKKRDS
jgi:transcriptional regulator with XRE-family HTH domain